MVGPARSSVDVQGKITVTLSQLAVGSYHLQAVYVDESGGFVSSLSSPVTITVLRGSTVTSLSSSVNPSLLNQATTFTITVRPKILVFPTLNKGKDKKKSNTVINAQDLASAITPQGSVKLFDNNILIGTASLSSFNAGGIGTITVASLAQGNHALTARFYGDVNFQESGASLKQKVKDQGGN